MAARETRLLMDIIRAFVLRLGHRTTTAGRPTISSNGDSLLRDAMALLDMSDPHVLDAE
jgi:hypothetical protein